MKTQFFFLILLMVTVISCSKKTLKGSFTNGHYQYETSGSGEHEVDHFEFKKNNRFEYSRIFCMMVEYGCGNYEINGDKIIFKFQHRDTTGFNINILPERNDSIIEVILKNDLVKYINAGCDDTTLIDYSVSTTHYEFPKDGFREHMYFKKDSILTLKNTDIIELYFSNCIDNITVPISKDYLGKSIKVELQFSESGNRVISDKIREFKFKKINSKNIIIDSIPFKRVSSKVSKDDYDEYQ